MEPAAAPLGVLRIATGVFLGLLAFAIFAGLIGVLGTVLFASQFSDSVLDSSETSSSNPASAPAEAAEPSLDPATGVPDGWADCGEGYKFVGGDEMCTPDGR